MVRLAEKAFAPGKVPFPLMHIDSKWKFKEMIQFRDEYARRRLPWRRFRGNVLGLTLHTASPPPFWAAERPRTAVRPSVPQVGSARRGCLIQSSCETHFMGRAVSSWCLP